ncbi:MAG TPA: hypothetical protein PKD51_11475 [Saprospiraceae bacterium]|nr:hypothetical protein [Saprospiraceae bacterium]
MKTLIITASITCIILFVCICVIAYHYMILLQQIREYEKDQRDRHIASVKSRLS